VVAAGRAPTVAVEAAFLVNFLRFTQWPAIRLPTDTEPYVVAVVGPDAVADIVRKVASAAGTVQGHPIGVVDIDPDDIEHRQAKALDILRGSHLVFVQSDDADVRRQVFDALAGSAVLTVGDSPDFAARGGMLGLVRSGSHLALEANPDQIQAAGVQVSAKVLKLARIRRSSHS
jgi:YfiR/HmsC-like